MVLKILIDSIVLMEQLSKKLENSLIQINLYLDMSDDNVTEQEFTDLRKQLLEVKRNLNYLRGRLTTNPALNEIILLYTQTMNRINNVDVNNNIIEHGFGVKIGGEHH